MDKQEEEWRWNQENNEGKKRGSLQLVEIYAHVECANHYNLAQILEIKELCKILLSDLFLRFIKIMPEKQFLLSLYLLQNLYIAIEIFLFSHYHFKIDC